MISTNRRQQQWTKLQSCRCESLHRTSTSFARSKRCHDQGSVGRLARVGLKTADRDAHTYINTISMVWISWIFFLARSFPQQNSGVDHFDTFRAVLSPSHYIPSSSTSTTTPVPVVFDDMEVAEWGGVFRFNRSNRVGWALHITTKSENTNRRSSSAPAPEATTSVF
jgi:hypothetical protein